MIKHTDEVVRSTKYCLFYFYRWVASVDFLHRLTASLGKGRGETNTSHTQHQDKEQHVVVYMQQRESGPARCGCRARQHMPASSPKRNRRVKRTPVVSHEDSPSSEVRHSVGPRNGTPCIREWSSNPLLSGGPCLHLPGAYCFCTRRHVLSYCSRHFSDAFDQSFLPQFYASLDPNQPSPKLAP